jgi:hypothetical protein
VVLPDRLAIGSIDGDVGLFRAASLGGHRTTADPASAPKGHDLETVRCLTLDTWIRRLEIPVAAIRFIKVDTQGWAGHVLQGAGALLDCRQIGWQLEVAPALLAKAGTDPADVYQCLAATFAHFIDLNAEAPGSRVRPTADLTTALAYLGTTVSYTNVLFFHAPRT